ncbi:MocR-like pyridoxine biosynthesis transcription factor PdxR [Pectinatus frisingensis]|uniref:MocR-like pyridoxine biosynthesis transcription factor PdxR n=1 Tax=Pectinatus frisingensis TaxID=865 RepID=UPI0018C72BDE|nr:PLP-dependent aminotransferase family protein [Pectinatus frisingensis]
MNTIQVERKHDIPMKRQIYQKIRDQILKGYLISGAALPSTRELAKQLKVSRNTICEAYEMLITEGFLIHRQGAATRVVPGLNIGTYSKKPTKIIPQEKKQYIVDFQTGRPDLRHFPQYLWQQIMYKTTRNFKMKDFGYGDPQGMLTLRREISAWLLRSKGLSVNEQDIFITSGATHALHLVSNLLGRTGNTIAVEDPCNHGVLQTIKNTGCSIKAIPVDEEGIKTQQLDKINVRAIYTTPSHQFPLGGILPAARRAALIRYAKATASYLVEDDYDSEFRYVGDPIAPLYAMAPSHVIYVGTFSKVLFPAIRIGYVILPQELQASWRELRLHTDVQNPPYEQAALAEFLYTRKFDRHIRTMKKLYKERRKILLTALKINLGSNWKSWGDAAGLHLAIEFQNRIFNTDFFNSCRESGIRITPVEYHAIQKGQHLNKLLLGYGHLETAEIQKGIEILCNVIKNL